MAVELASDALKAVAVSASQAVARPPNQHSSNECSDGFAFFEFHAIGCRVSMEKR